MWTTQNQYAYFLFAFYEKETATNIQADTFL